MNLFYFYTLSSLAIVALLITATTLFVFGRKTVGDWWLATFFATLVSNALWALAGPILAGVESTSHLVAVGDFVFRLIALIGYIALLGFVVVRKRSRAT
jgi:hypothetical protein